MRFTQALLACGVLLTAQTAFACRSPVDPERRAQWEARQQADDFREADIVVEGVLISPDPKCLMSQPDQCGKRIVAERSLKGGAGWVYLLEPPNVLFLRCSPNEVALGERGTFYLRAEDGYFGLFRSEKLGR